MMSRSSGENIFLNRLELMISSRCSGGITPVSYTHLDVYKRQLQKFHAHVQKMFMLVGESEPQASADAGTVIELRCV